MSDDLDRIRELGEAGALEDAVELVERHRAALDEQTLDETERALYARIWAQREWRSGARSSRTLSWALEVAETRELADADTATSLLLRAALADPHDDAITLAYLQRVLDTDYRYADRSLLDVARTVEDPERRRTLAIYDTFAEWAVLRSYLGGAPSVYVDAMKRSFAAAIALGADAATWESVRARVARELRSDIPAELFSTYGA